MDAVPAVNQATFPIATAPLELTASMLNSASSNQLRFWIQGVNDAARKRVLIKSGKVEELKARLAAHYGFDRSASASVVPTMGPLPLDKHIQKKQWDHLRDLGHEWAQTASAGHEFKLCASSKGTLCSNIQSVCCGNHLYTLQAQPPCPSASGRILKMC